MTGRTAIVAGTPWQVMGALSFAYATGPTHCQGVDLYLRLGFSGAEGLLERLRAEHLFNEVFAVLLSATDVLDARGGLQEMPRLENCAALLDSQLDHEGSERRYDLVLCTYPYDTASYLLALSPAAELWMYDDGIGSYAGNILKDNGGGHFPRPSRLYLCAPELCRGTLCDDVRLLPLDLADVTFRSLVARVFAISSEALSCYRDKRIVFLTQPPDARGMRYQEVTCKLLDILEDQAEQVIVRRHPRDTMAIDKAFAIDESGVPWEMACALGAIREDMLLLAECSTAQLTPTIIAGVEPRIVFLVNLYQQYAPGSVTQLAEQLIDIITSAHHDPSYVATPQSWEEFKSVLKL